MSYSIELRFAQTPAQVFAAVTDVRSWWSGEIDGDTDRLGAVFSYRYKDLHASKQQITEFVLDRRVVWHVVDACLAFVEDKTEWIGTDVVFDITARDGGSELRFEHRGLEPSCECYGACSDAWSFYIRSSLNELISTGTGQPNSMEGAAN